MREQPHHSSWSRVVAAASLLGLLLFWTASASHIHSAASQSGVRQECHLCLASITHQALTPEAPPPVALTPISILAAPSTEQHFVVHDYHPSAPRSPPFSLTSPSL